MDGNVTHGNHKKETLLAKQIYKYAEAMIDVERIVKILSEGADGTGMETDLKVGDIVIGKEDYEQGLFRVKECYEETVIKSDKNSRIQNHRVKADKSNPNSIIEKRVKVEKLNVFDWDDDKQSYKAFKQKDIIFRGVEKSFAEEYEYEKGYYSETVKNITKSPDVIEKANKCLQIVNRLCQLKPYTCYRNDKYGYLIKRNIQMKQIIFESKPASLIKHPLKNIGVEIAKEVDNETLLIQAHKEKRDSETDLGFGFKEELVMKSQHPDRIEKLIEKHGFEGMESTFD
jgi:hypothetical protein